jgi:hypothetical protein
MAATLSALGRPHLKVDDLASDTCSKRAGSAVTQGFTIVLMFRTPHSCLPNPLNRVQVGSVAVARLDGVPPRSPILEPSAPQHEMGTALGGHMPILALLQSLSSEFEVPPAALRGGPAHPSD